MINDATVSITTPARCGKRERTLIFIDGTAAATYSAQSRLRPGLGASTCAGLAPAFTCHIEAGGHTFCRVVKRQRQTS